MKGRCFPARSILLGSGFWRHPNKAATGVDAVFRITAQQDLYSAQSTLISTRADRLANLITLYKALGGGWR